MLVAACCRWPDGKQRQQAVRDAAAQGIDWLRFQAIVRRHRVEGLVWDALAKAGAAVPQEVASEIRAAAAGIARQNLRIAVESARLQSLFEAASIPIMFIKGVALGHIAYGSFSLKMGWDIDVLVSPEEVGAAAMLLREAGYTPVIPGPEFTAEQFERWSAHWKESVWRHRTAGFFVELHTRLVDNPLLLQGVDERSPSQIAEISPKVRLPTLRDEELFAYLCVHGASGAWSRIKWIADVAALLSSGDAAETERLYRNSQLLGSGRTAAQALLLCHFLFETPLSARLHQELSRDRVTRHLFRSALRAMAGRNPDRDPVDVRFGTVRIHLMQLFLLPGWRFKLSELWRQSVSPYDRALLPLPAGLAFLYPLLHVGRVVGIRGAPGGA